VRLSPATLHLIRLTQKSHHPRHSAANATHIVTSQQLSGSKTHKLLTTNSKVKVQLVKPEWVTDSIEAGIRRPERGYSVIKNAFMDSFVLSCEADCSIEGTRLE
jgi:hypothetical protein